MKILVAADPSQHSKEAIQFVKTVVWPENTELYLIHVIEMKEAPPIVPSWGPSSWDRVIAQARGRLVTESKGFLEQTKRDILKEKPSLAIRCLVVEGLPGGEILQVVEDYQIDLIILGTRGLSNVKRFLLGSTSDWVLRDAPCSVLLVRGKLSRATMGKTAPRFLLATDGSSRAGHLVQILKLLRCKTTPKVTVAHVVSRPVYLEGWYLGRGKAEFRQLAEQIMEKVEKDATVHLEEISQNIRDLNLKVDTVLTKGDPADEIVKTAENLKAKLIIVGSKGIVGGKLIPLGGFVRKISRYAPCSVLVTRPGRFKTES